MMETKVFADDFSCSFSEPRDFLQFLGERKAKSEWMTAPSKDLRFEPVEKGSALGDLYMKIYDHNGAADVLEDTMENTSLLLKVDGKDYHAASESALHGSDQSEGESDPDWAATGSLHCDPQV